jgi:hypothetical protein
MFGFRRRRRERIRKRPFPSAWLEILERNVAYYRLLTPEEQVRSCNLHRRVSCPPQRRTVAVLG